MPKFIHDGRLKTEADLLANAPKRKTRVSEALKSVDTRDAAKVSMGFEVAGFSPAHLAEGERKHEIEREGQKDRALMPKEKTLGPWNEEAYMREPKPKRVAPKPYNIASSADQCAELARKAGWKCVTVRELLKG
jgi:hypothetical protein